MSRDALMVRKPRAICLECRTVMPEVADCDGGRRHRVVALSSEAGREALAKTVWGPMSRRKQQALAVKSGATGGGAGILDGCAACDVVGGDSTLMVVLLAALATGLVVWGGYRLVIYLRQRANRLLPQGASERAPRLGPPTFEGTVRATEPLIAAPLSARLGVGWALALAVKRRFRHHVTLRDGHSAGFELVLDDGRVVTVSPGPLRMELSPARDAVPGKATVGTYLRELLPALSDAHGFDYVPWDIELETVLVEGDRITIHANLAETLAAAPARAQGYRDAPPTVLATVGTVGVRRLS